MGISNLTCSTYAKGTRIRSQGNHKDVKKNYYKPWIAIQLR